MKLVIDIDENTYNRIISGFANEDDATLFEKLFKDGTPLPKGHKVKDDEGKYHPEWDDFFEIDLCDDCYSRLRKDLMSKIVKKEGGDESV